MKKTICLLIIFVVLITTAISVAAIEPTLENLQSPVLEYINYDTTEDIGRSIWDMEVYGGKLYIGFGDYGSNLGSKLGGLPLLCYSDEINVWQLATTLDDEQVSRFFKFNDKLYITGTDPIKGVGSVYVGDKNGEWTTLSTFDGGTHVFDMLVSDNIMYVCYGQGYAAKPTVRYSKDFTNFSDIEFRYNGQPITLVYKEFSRSYNLFEFGGEVYATLKLFNATDEYDGIYKLDKENMVLNYVGKAVEGLGDYGLEGAFDTVFNGKFVLASSGELKYTSNVEDINSFKTLGGFEGKVTCAKVIDDSLYFTACSKNGSKYDTKLYKTKDFRKIETIYTLTYDSVVRSFCYNNGVFYLGTGSHGSSNVPSSGTVFSLRLEAYAKPEKTDITVKSDIKTNLLNDKPEWISYQLYAGDNLIEQRQFTEESGFEYTFSGVNKRDDWRIVVTGDSVGYEWTVENKDGVFVLSNSEKTPILFFYIAIIAAIVLLIVVVIILVFRRRSRKHRNA